METFTLIFNIAKILFFAPYIIWFTLGYAKVSTKRKLHKIERITYLAGIASLYWGLITL